MALQYIFSVSVVNQCIEVYCVLQVHLCAILLMLIQLKKNSLFKDFFLPV